MDVTGISKGKGFQGCIKREGFARQAKTHGNSLHHRAPGSIGAAGVGRVFKGKKMPGRMGGKSNTSKGLLVYKLDHEKGLIYLKGCLAGHNNSIVYLRDAV